jgi:GGDEF domain-containing protein
MKAWGDPPKRRTHDPEIQPLAKPRRQPEGQSPVEPYHPGPSGRGRSRPAQTRPTEHDAACGLGASAPDPRLPAIPRARAALDALGFQLGQDELRDPIVAAAALDALRRGVFVDTPLLLAVLDGPDFPWVWPGDGGTGSSLYRRCDGVDVHWRPREAEARRADPAAYARRLVEPIAQVQTLEFLAALADRGGPPGEAATPMLLRLTSTVESGFARFVAADDPWRDLFALWQLSRAPRLLERIWFLAVAIAYMYASQARKIGGAVIGTGPFKGEPLISASAALATVLWRLRIYPSLVPQLMAMCKRSVETPRRRRPQIPGFEPGAWGDPGQLADVLTTLVVADLLLSLDPDFDATATVDWLERRQEPEGWWRALGPEVPWLTGAVAELLERAQQPFPDRFRWPGALRLDLDRRTQIPTYAWFSDLARSVQEVPGLAAMTWEVAFIDLAGFGLFNNSNGMRMGDEVIAAFGRALTRIPGTRSIRDGGDEFVVIGTPGSSGLNERLEIFRRAWLVAFRESFGEVDPPVRPRILVTSTIGRELADTRDRLGREIGTFKKLPQNEDPPADGVQARI